MISVRIEGSKSDDMDSQPTIIVYYEDQETARYVVEKLGDGTWITTTPRTSSEGKSAEIVTSES